MGTLSLRGRTRSHDYSGCRYPFGSGVIGDKRSLEDESFSKGLLEYPQYTRPRSWKGMDVPEVLMSGHHKKYYGMATERSRGYYA